MGALNRDLRVFFIDELIGVGARLVGRERTVKL